MKSKLIVDFADMATATVENHVASAEQACILCGLNRRTTRRISKAVYRVLSYFPPAQLLEHSVQLAPKEFGWAIQFHFVAEPIDSLDPDESSIQSKTIGSLRRIGEKLELFQVKGDLADGFSVTISQSLGHQFDLPGNRELKQWSRVIAKGTWQDAFELVSKHYLAGRSKVKELRDGISIRRDVLDDDKQQANTILSLIASKTDNAVLLLDATGKIEWINQAACQTFTIDSQAAIGRDSSELFFDIANDPSPSQSTARQEFFKSLESGHSFSAEYFRVSDSEDSSDSLWTAFQLTPVRDEHDTIARWIAIGSDVTQRRKAELAMKAAKEVAENANKAKSDFLAMMSHEIRTPMNAIIGMTELTLGTKLTVEQRDFLTTSHNSAQSLLQILNDILDLSKVEAARLELEKTDFNIADVVGDTLATLRVLAGTKGIALLADFPEDMPLTLIGDPVRLRQVIVNLVGNAIKFTSAGEVVVSASLSDETNSAATIQFSVRDTGVGIAEEKTSRIFEAFYQTDASVTRNFGGTGLGLAITSELVRLMGGRIWVESKLGVGSTFHFVLTLPKSKRKKVPTEANQNSIPAVWKQTDSPLNVLVVDDHPSNRALAGEILRRRGHKWMQAANGTQAFELIQQNNFDVVMMDVQMPEQDGLETTLLVRNLDDAKSMVPIIAVTAYVAASDRERCLEARMDDYLSKPLNSTQFIKTVERWGRTKRTTLETSEASQNLAEQLEIQDVPNWAAQVAQAVAIEMDDTSEPDDANTTIGDVASSSLASTETTGDPAAIGDTRFAPALARLGGDEELLKMQMGFFLAEAPQLMQNINAAVTEKDASTLHLNAHRLKGLVRSYDDSLAEELTTILENIGREGDFANAESTFHLLESCVDSLSQLIEEYSVSERT